MSRLRPGSIPGRARGFSPNAVNKASQWVGNGKAPSALRARKSGISGLPKAVSGYISAASGLPSTWSRPSERAGKGLNPCRHWRKARSLVLEVDTLVSGSGFKVTRILFAKPVPTFAECAPSTYRTCRLAAGPLLRIAQTAVVRICGPDTSRAIRP